MVKYNHNGLPEEPGWPRWVKPVTWLLIGCFIALGIASVLYGISDISLHIK